MKARVDKSSEGQQAKVLAVLSSAKKPLCAVEILALDRSIGEDGVYVSLKRLSDKGLIRSKKAKRSVSPGAPRRYYTILTAGTAVLPLMKEVAELKTQIKLLVASHKAAESSDGQG